MFLNNHNKKAFTLIELLVVIVIIGILATLATVALTSSRSNARDARRISDLRQISSALELYYADNNGYPTIITPGNALTNPDQSKTYMAKIPTNPTPRAEGPCANVEYQYAGTTSNFSLIGCLAKATGDASVGARRIERDGTARDLGPMNDLIVWYRPGEFYNTSAKNLSGDTLSGVMTSIVANASGNAVFNGDDSKIVFNPSIAGIKTVFLRMNLTPKVGSNGIFTFGVNPDNLVVGYSDTSLYINPQDGGTNAKRIPNFPINQFVDLAIIKDVGNITAIYLNGQSITLTSTGSYHHTGVPGLGYVQSPPYAQYFGKFELNDFRIYNRTLTSTEITQIYNSR